MTTDKLLSAVQAAPARRGERRAWLEAGAWIVLGLTLRVWQFGWHPLREDEALYAYWARLIASGRDVMLERVAVDKPPFFIYALARWFQWFGPSDGSGRSFNILLSTLTMILFWRLAQRVYGPRAGLWSLAFFALSPFAISFAPTLYTDPMLTLWIALALWLASWRLGLLSGLALGMGFATKQSALLFTPLLLLALWLGRPPQWQRSLHALIGRRCAIANRRGAHRLTPARVHMAGNYGALLAFSLGFGYITYKIWQWDHWRILPAHIPGFWTQAWHSYGGLRLVSPAAWPARAAAWWEVGRWWGGGLVETMVWIGLSLIAVLAALRGVSGKHAVFSVRHTAGGNQPTDGQARRASLWTLLFAGFILFYLALHLAVSFQTWDRYLLPLAPLAAMLAARGAMVLWDATRGRLARWRWGTAAALVLVLSLGAIRAASARIPVGGDHGAYDGLIAVAHYLEENVPPYHGVIYQRWLGWQWNWYLWDRRDRVYWEDVSMLTEDLASDPYGYARFVVFPAWELDEKPALAAALARLGLHLEERLRVKDGRSEALHFVVYEIEPHIRLWK